MGIQSLLGKSFFFHQIFCPDYKSNFLGTFKRGSMRPPPKIVQVGCRKILLFEMTSLVRKSIKSYSETQIFTTFEQSLLVF
jgi:hypothetical protein